MPPTTERFAHFNPSDPAFIADPYPVLAELRETTPIFWNNASQQWMLTRFDDVAATLRDRRLGRAYTHRFTHAELGRPEPDPRWADFNEHEEWSVLALEPPDHTRLRRLVQKVFTPRAVAGLGGPIAKSAEALLDRCAELDTFDLLADFAQPFSVGVICSMLGVPKADAQALLDWSHAIVKMYELEADDETKIAANQAAAEFIAYTRSLIKDKRRQPDGLLVSELARVEDEGDTLTEAEIVSTTMVLLEAGHEATVNTLGNGFRALMHHRDQWRRLTNGEVTAMAAVEELLRWDSPLQMFERWVLDDGGGDRRTGNRRRPRSCDALRRSATGSAPLRRSRPFRHRPQRRRPHRIRWRNPLLRRCSAGTARACHLSRGHCGSIPRPHARRGAPVSPHIRDPRTN